MWNKLFKWVIIYNNIYVLISNGTEVFPSLPTSTVGERDTGDAQDDWGDAHVDWGVDEHHGSVM